MYRRQFILAAAAAIAGSASVVRCAGHTTQRRGRHRMAHRQRRAADLAWYDVREWGVEGRGFDDTAKYFDRLPARAEGVVRDAVWNLSRHTSGMTVFFETDSPGVHVRYTLTNGALAMPHMPATGVSGVDLYGMTDRGWQWLATHSPKAAGIESTLIDHVAPGARAYHLNLPLYNGVVSFEVGVEKGAAFTPVAPRKDKPLLFYGTSITQGACASRPGMSFTNILGRRLKRPVLNFGFSGNGLTEPEVARFLAELDPAVFVLDTSANTPADQLRARTETVVRILRKDHAKTPVLLLAERRRSNMPLVPSLDATHRLKTLALRQGYDNLLAAGVTDLHFRDGDDLLGDDGEATVDGSHPSDLGMTRYADALEPGLRRLLGGA